MLRQVLDVDLMKFGMLFLLCFLYVVYCLYPF